MPVADRPAAVSRVDTTVVVLVAARALTDGAPAAAPDRPGVRDPGADSALPDVAFDSDSDPIMLAARSVSRSDAEPDAPAPLPPARLCRGQCHSGPDIVTGTLPGHTHHTHVTVHMRLTMGAIGAHGRTHGAA